MDKLYEKKLTAVFFCTESGTEPVREWLKSLVILDRKKIGCDIKTVEFGWPIGMPVCRSMQGHKGLWEVRSKISDDKIARILFMTDADKMLLLHGFIKKSQKTPNNDLDLAIQRKKIYDAHRKKHS